MADTAERATVSACIVGMDTTPEVYVVSKDKLNAESPENHTVLPKIKAKRNKVKPSKQ